MDTRQMKEDNKRQIYNEASIMKKLFHPNVISFKEVFKDVKLDYFYIVMEYANDGDLSKKIKAQKQKNFGEKYFSEEKIMQYFYQICRGLQYIHSKNIIHRDIKSQNIFLMKNGKLKIGDFGIAKALTNTKNNATTIIGTPYYLSPEVINGEPYNYKTDIWSLGVVLYEMCCLKLPFEGNNIAALSIKIMKGKYDPIPNKYSKNMSNLIKNMLNIDQKLRPNITEVMQNPLVKNYAINKYSNKSYKNLMMNKKIINSIESQLNFKINDQTLGQKKEERKSEVNKIKNKEKSCSPIKLKNKSYIGKIIKQNNESSESVMELPKASNKNKTKKSSIFKRIETQNIISKINIKEEIDINKINQVNKSNNNINNLFVNNNIFKSMNQMIEPKKNIINEEKQKNMNIKSTNNFINKSINSFDINKNSNINKGSNNDIINKNIFYNINSTNKEEIINRSNEFDVNFSGKSILFDKEKTINLFKEREEKEEDKDESKDKILYDKNLLDEKSNPNKNIDETLFNFNLDEKTIIMHTLKEEEEEETIKSQGTLYNGDFENLNFQGNNKITNVKDKEIKSHNNNDLSKEEDNNNIIKVDLDFEIINNSMSEEKKEKEEKEFNMEEYIKKQIGEKIYLIIKQNWTDFNIEQIVNYSYESFINKLRDILEKNQFREREIKKAEMYLFDIFFNIINKNNY